MMRTAYSVCRFHSLALLSLAGACTAWAVDNAQGNDPAAKDAEYRRLIIGTWRDHYQGTRTMIVHTNGTGTMIVELRGLKAALYAKRLRFDMVWSIENGRMKKRTTGGEPSGKVNMILKMMGDRVDEPILELTQERLLLLDKDGKRKYDWKRIHTEE